MFVCFFLSFKSIEPPKKKGGATQKGASREVIDLKRSEREGREKKKKKKGANESEKQKRALPDFRSEKTNHQKKPDKKNEQK